MLGSLMYALRCWHPGVHARLALFWSTCVLKSKHAGPIDSSVQLSSFCFLIRFVGLHHSDCIFQWFYVILMCPDYQDQSHGEHGEDEKNHALKHSIFCARPVRDQIYGTKRAFAQLFLDLAPALSGQRLKGSIQLQVQDTPMKTPGKNKWVHVTSCYILPYPTKQTTCCYPTCTDLLWCVGSWMKASAPLPHCPSAETEAS
jgi:hypothetical protein